MSNSFTNQTLAQIELWTNHKNYENKVYVFQNILMKKLHVFTLQKLVLSWMN